MKFKRQRAAELDVNLTPLIDVVFLLLIFFMVSTTFTKETHLQINLPEASGDAVVDDPLVIDISITTDGNYSINGQRLVNGQIETIKRGILKAARNKEQLPVTITADAQAPHQSVISAMDAAGQLGFVRLSIATRSSEKH